MVDAIIRWCLNNRFLVVLTAVLALVAGYYCLVNTPVDAIPDIGEKQVIVFAEWAGRSPQDVEDQVTYPLVTNLQGLAGVRVVRASSAFSFSMITGGSVGAPWTVGFNSWFNASTMSGGAFKNGRMYYTKAGQNNLYFRYFEPDGYYVGCTEFTIPTTGVTWSSVRGLGCTSTASTSIIRKQTA